MTIATGVLAADGVVLAADSTTTFMTSDGKISSLLTGGQKIFQLGMDRPYAFVLFGNASFGSSSYRDLLTLFDATLGTDNPPVSAVAERFHDFAMSRWPADAEKYGLDPSLKPSTGFLIGGKGTTEPACSLSRVVFGDEMAYDGSLIRHVSAPGAFQFEGCPNVASRLVYGFDDSILQKILPFIPENQRDAVIQQLLAPDDLRAAPSPSLPLRDAIDYLYWIVLSTIKYYKFAGGPQICGGKVELACVTSDRGFRWVTHKSLDWNVGDEEGQTTYSPLDPHRLGR